MFAGNLFLISFPPASTSQIKSDESNPIALSSSVNRTTTVTVHSGDTFHHFFDETFPANLSHHLRHFLIANITSQHHRSPKVRSSFLLRRAPSITATTLRRYLEFICAMIDVGSFPFSRRKKVSTLELNLFGSCMGVYSSDVSISGREAAQDYTFLAGPTDM